MKSTFTVEEIADAIRHFDLEAFVHEDPTALDPIQIRSSFEGLHLGVWFPTPGPFFEEALLIAITAIEENPIEWSLRWNGGYRWTTGVPSTDEQGALSTTEEGDFLVSIRRMISFRGGISDQALISTVGNFLVDFIALHGLDDEEDTQIAHGESLIDLPEAITAELELESPQTARDLSRSLNTSKREINSVLYSRPDLFVRKQADPPLWSIRRAT